MSFDWKFPALFGQWLVLEIAQSSPINSQPATIIGHGRLGLQDLELKQEMRGMVSGLLRPALVISYTYSMMELQAFICFLHFEISTFTHACH